jgi:hypothetical protein
VTTLETFELIEGDEWGYGWLPQFTIKRKIFWQRVNEFLWQSLDDFSSFGVHDLSIPISVDQSN